MEPDRPNVTIPPPLLFFAFLIIAGLLEYTFGSPGSKGYWGWRILFASIVFILSGYLALGALMVLKLRKTNIDPRKPTIKIVDKGPFKWSRNPMYLSLVLAMIVFSILFWSIWFLFAGLALWGMLDRMAVQPEENYLEKKFGNRYLKYQSRVRRWL